MSFQDFGTLIITFINMPIARVILGENSLHSEFYGNSISDKIKEVVQYTELSVRGAPHARGTPGGTTPPEETKLVTIKLAIMHSKWSP